MASCDYDSASTHPSPAHQALLFIDGVQPPFHQAPTSSPPRECVAIQQSRHCPRSADAAILSCLWSVIKHPSLQRTQPIFSANIFMLAMHVFYFTVALLSRYYQDVLAKHLYSALSEQYIHSMKQHHDGTISPSTTDLNARNGVDSTPSKYRDPRQCMGNEGAVNGTRSRLLVYIHVIHPSICISNNTGDSSDTVGYLSASGISGQVALFGWLPAAFPKRSIPCLIKRVTRLVG
ncbi:hypothetical protein J3F84DRAFT_256099 [Trichoderma pleuroticola]